MNQHAMDSSAGAAVRVQLDGMIAALAPFDDHAGKIGDSATLRLIANLYAAREAAAEIEQRPQPQPRKPQPPVQPLATRGVRFAKP